jgi:putative tricarboxylic transport membrane protein
MRAVFTILILCVSVFYTYWAFADLSFLSSAGRLGPGFFPRIIGIALILACLAELVMNFSHRPAEVETSEHTRTVAHIGGLSIAFVVVMYFLGGYVGMIGFLLAALTLLNRGRPLQNVAMALLLPLGVYLLFEAWLNAAVPPGVLFQRWFT